MKNFSLWVVFLCSCWAAEPAAFGYNRDTHQHITELAYAYLKLMDSCQPIEFGDTQACESTCKADLKAKNLQRGYTCNCLYDVCAIRGEKCSESSNGYEEYSCTLDCVNDGAFGSQCLDFNRCPAPYYFHEDWGNEIIADSCRRSCVDSTTSQLSPQCRPLAGVFDSPFIAFSDAESTVSYFQKFRTSACPSRAFSYHGMRQCDDNPPSAQIVNEKGEEVRPAYPARDNIYSERKALVEWEEAAGAGYRLGANARLKTEEGVFRRDYIPVSGKVLGTTRFLPGSFGIDYTGTILGFHAGVVDKLDDLHFTTRMMPVVEDSIKTALEVAAAGGSAVLGAVVAVGGILACALTCPITVFFGTCDDCFSEIFSGSKQIYEAGYEATKTIEEQNWLGTHPSTTVLSADATSMFHFMNAPPLAQPFTGIYDDRDGYIPSTAFGPQGNALGQAYDAAQLDQIFADVRVSFPESRRVLENYQISNADDDSRNSIQRPLPYWTRLGLLDYTMPPVDNLAYYWWHKWLYSRINGKAEAYGLLPLGAVFHAVQDITQPFHAWGVTLNGHVSYEDFISNHLDPTSAALKNPNTPSTDLIWDLDNPAAEQEFLAAVTTQINRIYREVIAANGKVLHIRKLVHYLYNQTVHADTGLKWTEEEGWAAFASLGFDYDPERVFIRQTAIPLAVAASVVIMMEASRKDMSRYESAFGLALSDFEHQGAVPPLSSADLSAGPNGFSTTQAQPAWTCASESLRGKKAVEDYYADQLTGREALRVLFMEKSRCDFQEIGMPTDEPLLETLGRLEADRLEAGMAFLRHGDKARLEKEVACANALASPFLAPENGDLFAARCDGTLDSDFDGVVDQNDECATPRKLLQEGYSVDAKGCVFTHESAPEMKITSYILGAVKK